MPLTDIDFKLSYNSREDDVINEFFIPCFKRSVSYERAVGFFTSEALLAFSSGIHEFISHDGFVKLICSPKLNEADFEAIANGYRERDLIFNEALSREIARIPDDIVDTGANFLSYLISANRLDIKIALPDKIRRENYGIYHEKIGLFHDNMSNFIAFSGSNNETLGGIAYNYESFDVYKSWVDNKRCCEKMRHFQNLWNDTAFGIKTYDFPVAVKHKLVEKVKPQEHPEVSNTFNAKKVSLSAFISNLWYFQKKAINAFKANKYKGILSMATGTGKTKTAIGAIIELKKEIKKLFVVVACPQNTIMRQWESDINLLSLFQFSIIADSTNQRWNNEIADKIIDFNANHIDNCMVYTTYNTLCSEKFINLVSSLKNNNLLICDEVHWAGADTFQNGLLPTFDYRLGLSATPKRYMDETGSDFINQYFEKVVYEFSLERALKEINPSTGETFLCPYDYYPIFVCLNDTELLEYSDLSAKIKRQYAKEIDSDQKSEYLQRLYEKRQAVIIDANAKYQALEKLLDSLQELQYLLIYCSPQQIGIVQDILNARSVPNHKFTGEEGTSPRAEYKFKSERDYILENFEKGSYIALVAMRCLDEGVNILRAETGILMASTGNPKQYVQRRGRLLRRHINKTKVYIYDIIVLPYLDPEKAREADEEELKILEKELVRYEEFANLADNKVNAINKIFDIKKIYSFFKIN